MDRLIKMLKKKNVLKDRLYETTDGCGAQYRSATALLFLSSLSAKHNIVINQSYGAPGHVKLHCCCCCHGCCYCCCCCSLFEDSTFVIVIVVVVVVVCCLLYIIFVIVVVVVIVCCY
jgi:hypothetical protein